MNVPAGKRYWEDRSSSLYLQAVKDIVSYVGRDADSIIDVGSNACPYLDWFDWIPNRTSLDLHRPYAAEGVMSVKANFLDWTPDKQYDVLTCLQVMEHVPPVEAFAKKVLEVAKIAVVSLPYKWDPKYNKTHIHDPVDEDKILSWFGRKPNAEFKIREVVSGAERIIHIYEDPAFGAYKQLRSRQKRLERLQAEAAE